jgi:alanine racemase
MYVKDQSEAVCLEAVKKNGDALMYVKDQSEAVCLEAVKNDGYALRYVKVKKTLLKIIVTLKIK